MRAVDDEFSEHEERRGRRSWRDTEAGWGRRDVYRPPEMRSGAGPVWWVGALLVLAGAAWLGALSLSQLSSREVAIPAIERGVAALTEVDELLAIHEQDLCELAETDSALQVSRFPVRGVEMAVSDIHCTDGRLDRDALRALLLERSAEQVYTQGADAFLDESEEAEASSILSTTGAARLTLDSIGESMHERSTRAAWILGGISLLLLAGVIALGRGVRRFAGVGIVLVLIATPTMLGVMAAWVLIGQYDSGTGVTAQFADIVRSLLDLPMRNAVALLAGGVALLVPVLAVDWVLRRTDRREWWEQGR
ncbi:MAG: hypothetical protein AB7L91_10475 [Dehalococcoidia bacterium]